MAQMTDDDHYIIQIYPKARKATLVFIGGCWEYNQELTFNGRVANVIRHYSPDRVLWADRETIADGYYQFTWERPVLDIKGDG